MVKVPRFACSHTVTGTCTIRLTTDLPAAGDATIAAGTYWTDPVYTGSGVAVDLLQVLAGKWFTVLGESVTSSYYAAVSNSIYQPTFTAGSGNQLTYAAHANNTAEGKRLLARIGVPPLTGSDTSDTLTTAGLLGVWGPNGRAESGDMREGLTGETGSVTVSADGTAYSVYTGEPQRSRLVVLQALPGAYVLRGGRALGGGDYSIQTHLYDVLRRGERVRYYEDVGATYTYLTASCSATGTSVTLASNTGCSQGDTICVNGEVMRLNTNTSGTTWTVDRMLPVAHEAWEPVGVDGAWVATYALAADGGNVSRGEFSPARRSINQDRWDVTLSLVRGTP